MKLRHACLFALIGFFNALAAQTPSKLDLRLWSRLQQTDAGSQLKPLLVKGKAADIKRLSEQYGGVYKWSHGLVSSVEIPMNRLLDFSKRPEVLSIENTSAIGVALMDTARIRNNVDSVHAGLAPLADSLKGKGVIMGVIDGGLAFNHADFKNPADNTTRVRYIWDQSTTGANAPQPYAYGNQWNWIDIDAGNCTHEPPSSDFGHGTCVAGIAAGNSYSTKNTAYENQLTGIAPESEIIFVKIENQDFLVHVADAVDYIFKKADAMGKPCVINTSIGTYYGSHDGRDLTTNVIEDLLTQRNGRVLVAAGGNGGHINHHLSYTVTPDSAFTFFKYNTTYNEVYFDLWADTADFNNVQFTIGCNDRYGVNLGRIDYLKVPIDFNPPQGSGIILTRNLFQGGNLLGQILMQATLEDDRYHVEFLINPGNNTSQLWRLQTMGTGRFDLWSSSALIGSADMATTIQTTDTANPVVPILYPEYRHPDSLKTMVSSWQCSDKVITVGNYSNRAGYLDRDGNYVDLLQSPYNETVGKRFATSSFGPTRDGRLKPDVMATGSTTIATGDPVFIQGATSAANRVKVYITQKHIRNGGTSMAAPIVSGIAALYLQKRPTATFEEIKLALTCTATRDNFTGSNPNSEYGHGKVNAFAALTRAHCVVLGTTDTGCINYTAQATIDTGGCVARVYGCTDTAANNYNPLANAEDGSCDYTTGIPGVTPHALSLKALPNPFKCETVFELSGNPSFTVGEIQIYNYLGARQQTIYLNNQTTRYLYRHQNAAGIYFYRLITDGEIKLSGKLVAQ